MKKNAIPENHRSDLKLLFCEDFSTRTDSLPGSWYVEQNSDMPHVPAIRNGENCIELLSAGNKFLPLIPQVKDFILKCTFFVNERSSAAFGLVFCFGYDVETARGFYLAVNRQHDAENLTLEYGSTRLNKLDALQTEEFKPSKGFFAGKIDCSITVCGKKLLVFIDGKEITFDITEPAGGVIALARTHFFGLLKLYALSIEGTPLQKKHSILKKTTIPLPSYQTHYPIYCDVTISEYGNIVEADLTMRGSVPEYPPGEGNYHGIRSDLLTKPYFKVLTKEQVFHHTLYNDTLVLVPPGLVQPCFFEELNKPCQWPFSRKIRFMKPQGKFDLAVGFESYFQNTAQNQSLTPAETIFDSKGNILYSSLGLTDGTKIKTDFISQEDKAILSRIPETDPRYEKAVRFAKKNHYFMEGETPCFQISLTSKKALPANYEVLLEDVCFRPIRKVRFKTKNSSVSYGVSAFNRTELTCQALKDLPCGVYHLRVRSLDPSVQYEEKYCAFEIMSKKKDAPVAPHLSGLPFLYNARTETRGLMTDSFDPYLGESVNEGHYVGCTVILPEAWKKYAMAPVIKAYQRKNFAWISRRTLDDPSFEANREVIRDSDYVNFNLEGCKFRHYATAIRTYTNENFRMVIDFLKTLSDPFFDIPALEKLCSEGGTLPVETYYHMAENYWEQYLDHYSTMQKKWMTAELEKVRKVNKKAKLCLYGPFAIYASACKGADVPRLHGNTQLGPDMIGFWQFEDYPVACGYLIERGAFVLASCLMTMPEGSRIYPEIYSYNPLKRYCPDGAVFYAHPPFGDCSGAQDPKGRVFAHRVFNYVYGSAYLSKGKFRYWTERGFQTCNFPDGWFEVLLKAWGFIRENEPLCPLRSIGYVAPGASLKENPVSFIHDQGGRLVVRKTSTEDVPCMFEEAVNASVGSGFVLLGEEILSLTTDQLHTLVLPPVNKMNKKILDKIRSLHEEGVNLVCFENAGLLEDLFGVRDTKVMRTITKVTPTGTFCENMSEYCDDEHCCGSYEAITAEVLLDAEIPVLTRKKNAKAYAVFFNVPPHLVKEIRLHAKGSHGKPGISPLMSKACGEIMRFLEQGNADIAVSTGRLLTARTQDGKTVAVVYNPSGHESLVCEITVRNSKEYARITETEYPLTLVRKNKDFRTFRFLLPPGKYMTILFSKGK